MAVRGAMADKFHCYLKLQHTIYSEEVSEQQGSPDTSLEIRFLSWKRGIIFEGSQEITHYKS